MWMLLMLLMIAGAVLAGFALFAAWSEVGWRKQFEATLTSEDADRLRAFLLAEGSWSEFAELAQAGSQDDAAELMQARRALAADWLPLSVR
jgi:hypothetical protein